MYTFVLKYFILNNLHFCAGLAVQLPGLQDISIFFRINYSTINFIKYLQNIYFIKLLNLNFKYDFNVYFNIKIGLVINL